MATDLDTHGTRVIYFIGHKLDEMAFFHSKIIEASTFAMERIIGGGGITIEVHNELNYHFSGFVNCIQSLKDMLTTVVGPSITWKTFESLPHGEFFKNARNAITHDGMQLITGMSNGHLMFNRAGGMMTRPDQRGAEQDVHLPDTPAALTCLTFFNAFLVKVQEIVRANASAFAVSVDANRDMLNNELRHLVPNLPQPIRQLATSPMLTALYEKHLHEAPTLDQKLEYLIRSTHIQPDVGA